MLLLDCHAWPKIVAERDDRAAGRAVPLRWFGFLDDLSTSLSGQPAALWTWADALNPRGHLVAWHPSRMAMAAAFAGKPMTYLCWGLPDYTGPKAQVFDMLLRRARHVVVNEEVTQCQIRDRIGRTAPIVPYFVDTAFFAFAGPERRQPFLFCNGANDRDPEMLVALAALGHQIVWLCNDPALIAAYAKRHPKLRIVTRPSYEELRTLYQTCAAAIMPVTRDAHAAGQTTGLEAISCGAPLVISTGRTATIFRGLPSVFPVDGFDPGEWSRTISKAISRAADGQPSSLSIRRSHSFRSVRDALTPTLDVGTVATWVGKAGGLP